MHDHADRKFCLGEKANNCRRMIDDGLFTLYAPGSGEPEIKLADQRIKAIANQFRRMQADKGVTFYMVFYLPDDEDERNTMLAMIQSLKDDYQEAIMFLGINSDFDQREQEKNLFYPFYSMFPFKPNEPSPTSQEKLSPMSTQRFKIALSFPGEHRSFVEQVASKLAHEVGRYQVLYDRYYEAEFARPDLDTYLQRLYHDESELIAVFLCADYERKEWCGLEWRAVRDLIKKRKASTVMPLRFDNTEIPGLFSIDGYVWIDKRTPEQIADLILQRMGKHP